MVLPNQLIFSNSPYLLQHAYNPISWYIWHQSSLTKARKEDKPILLSIGYAACHWCHVMDKEVFQNKEVADIMNIYFINIKVDREENPAIDQVAIEAMQAMGLEVGWPMHVFLMPNQQPFYGGTYFAKETWKQLLLNIAVAFEQEREKLTISSGFFMKTLQNTIISNKKNYWEQNFFNKEYAQKLFRNILQNLDQNYGGIEGSPKFFLPSVNKFLRSYYAFLQEEKALEQLVLTLDNIACGGIHDHLNGGFHRYAIDENWKIPHFEKMLYDNAQLISLYAQAYTITNQELYKDTLLQTLQFVQRDMCQEEGGLYSSLDADSNGVEGAFYTWRYQQIQELLKENLTPFILKYNVTLAGNWENGLNVLYKNKQKTNQKVSYPNTFIEQELIKYEQILFAHRNTTNEKPTVNKQIITSWNAMMLQAWIDAYYALGDIQFLTLALKNASYLQKYLKEDSFLWHSYSQDTKGNIGYLEDYAWLAKSFINLYQATLESHWLLQAQKLVDYTITNFLDSSNGLFYFSSHTETVLIKRSQEISDLVIPSSNSIMAYVLFALGKITNQSSYIIASQRMLHTIKDILERETVYMTYWAYIYLLQIKELPVITVTGPDSVIWGKFIKRYYPDVLLAGESDKDSSFQTDKSFSTTDLTIAYICCGTVCYIPLYSLEKTLLWLKDWVNK